MKKVILTFSALVLSLASVAQVIQETVSIGPGYANHGFYSLENGDVGQVPKNAWDLAFDVSGFGSGIRINGTNSVKLWRYPNAGNSAFGTALDTTGITSWPRLINSDTSWTRGAFNQNNNPNNPFDLGWGTYNTVTHAVNGDSLYIIELSGNRFKQLDIVELMTGQFRFRYADLDGSNLVLDTLRKSEFPGKNFGYYDFTTQDSYNLEPVSNNDWDLLFTQYVTRVGSTGTIMSVAGVFSNTGVEVAKLEDHPDHENYTNWGGKNYSFHINTIGYDWKTLNYQTFQFDVQDSLLFFVKAKTGDVWKLVFTGFGGSSNGNYEFTKEKLSTASLEDNDINYSARLSLYPNPNDGNQLHLVYDIPEHISTMELQVLDLTGRNVYSTELTNSGGFKQQAIGDLGLKSGTYIVQLQFDNQALQQKLIVK